MAVLSLNEGRRVQPDLIGLVFSRGERPGGLLGKMVDEKPSQNKWLIIVQKIKGTGIFYHTISYFSSARVDFINTPEKTSSAIGPRNFLYHQTEFAAST